MEKINYKLKNYIEKHIMPLYQQNDLGHDIKHIKYVIKRSLEFAKQFQNINLDMVYAIASFHDLAHHIDKDNHELLSAKIFYENEDMKNFFDEEQRKIIFEAIEDHRASLKTKPRSDYGKIISSADRSTSINSILQRTHSYSVKHFPQLCLYQMIERSYNHTLKKYGNNGYAKNYCYDKDYKKFKLDVATILKNKWDFTKKYLEANMITSLKEKAKLFAINAHKGQIRKSEPDKPMIIHPISVGMILEEYGYDEAVISAGYLHDVVEDTSYKIEEIKTEFGEDIGNLVMVASEPDKSLSWEERKSHTIEETKKLTLRNKLVICADKINNLEDLMLKFQKNGKRDFSTFKRGQEQQKWYYTSIYESLVHGEDENLPIFKRLKNILDIVFYEKEDLYLKDTIFADNKEYYAKLIKLHAQKEEIKKLKSLSALPKPFVIEFSGTPRTGKTTTINNLYDFFKKGGFKVAIIEEFTTSKYYKEVFKPKYKKNSSAINKAIIEETTKQLEEAINSDKEIILIDRSINDRQIWNYERYIDGNMSQETYTKLKEKYSRISRNLIDFLVITYAEPLVSLKRDYNSSLALEKRNFLNIDNLNEYNKSLNALAELFKISVENLLLLDTSEMSMSEVSIIIASQIMTSMRSKYINFFKQKYCPLS